MGIINRITDNVYIKRTCPQCIQEFYPGDCDIVSTTTIDSTTKTNKVLKKAPRSGWQQHLSRINPERIHHDLVLDLACRKCPHCGYLLPSNIELVENINIAIVGDLHSGKSHYIAALIHQIQRGELQRTNRFARFACLTQKVEQDYRRDVIRPLFEEKKSPAPTQAATGLIEPLIYELVMSPSPGYPTRRINLMLYDASGEDLAVRERMVMVARYVLNANAIIFLADPTTMDAIYKQLPVFLQNKLTTGRTASDVLNSIIKLFEDYHGHSPGAPLTSIPIAVTLPKSDLLKQLTSVQNSYSFLKRPVYNGVIDLQDMNTVDREVRQLLETYGERHLLQATQNFAKVKFFATSATGYAPDKNGIYPAIDPCRCLDPILWILYELGILRLIV